MNQIKWSFLSDHFMPEIHPNHFQRTFSSEITHLSVYFNVTIHIIAELWDAELQDDMRVEDPNIAIPCIFHQFVI